MSTHHRYNILLAVIAGIISCRPGWSRWSPTGREYTLLHCEYSQGRCRCSTEGKYKAKPVENHSPKGNYGQANLEGGRNQEIKLKGYDVMNCWGYSEYGPYAVVSRLDMNGTGFVKIERDFFRGLELLKHLNLDDNELPVFRRGWFHRLINLISLSMASNKMEEWVGFDQVFARNTGRTLNHRHTHKTPFSSLRRLDIGFNRFISLQEKVLRQFSNLRYFNAESNRIETIQIRAFGHWKNLKTLILRNNRLCTPGLSRRVHLALRIKIDASENRCETNQSNTKHTGFTKVFNTYAVPTPAAFPGKSSLEGNETGRSPTSTKQDTTQHLGFTHVFHTHAVRTPPALPGKSSLDGNETTRIPTSTNQGTTQHTGFAHAFNTHAVPTPPALPGKSSLDGNETTRIPTSTNQDITQHTNHLSEEPNSENVPGESRLWPVIVMLLFIFGGVIFYGILGAAHIIRRQMAEKPL